MNRWLITNARLVNEGSVTETDLRIRNERIEQIRPALRSQRGEMVFDARGRFLLPGMIDTHVHFREPGQPRKGNIASESRAAVAGGVTSFVDLPDNRPPTTSSRALADKFSRARGRARANFSFSLGATGNNLDEIRALAPGQACAVHVSMGGADELPSLDHADRLAQVFAASRLPVTAHCEDASTIEANLTAALRRHGRDIPAREHAGIRSREACLKAARLAVELARECGTRLHVFDLSTAGETELFERGTVNGKAITAGAAIAHLYFIEDDYEALGHRIKVNPSIKSADDRRALRQALRETRIDVIATGHAPHPAADKGGDYTRAAAGMPLVQHALPAAWSLVATRILTPETLVEKIAHNPARRFHVAERGFVREGYYADLVLLDDGARPDVDGESVLSHCGWTPFAGRRLPATIAATWVNGHLVWRDGLLTGSVPGQPLTFDRD